jgi:hypothetical protein
MILFRLFLFGVGLLPVSIFLAADGLSRHVAWIVVERSLLFLARLFLVGILVIGHGILPEKLVAGTRKHPAGRLSASGGQLASLGTRQRIER